MKKEIRLPVGTHRQQTPFSCGPAALKIVLDFYGRRIPERRLWKVCKTTEKEGTWTVDFISAAKKFGKVRIKEKASLRDIEAALKRKNPAIIEFQSWHGGHYAVIIGTTPTHIILSDPAKGYRTIRKDLFVRRWWEKEKHKIWRRLMILLS